MLAAGRRDPTRRSTHSSATHWCAGACLETLLADAEILTLPAGWAADGRPPDAAAITELLADLQTVGFPVWDWFGPALAVGGILTTRPPPGP